MITKEEYEKWKPKVKAYEKQLRLSHIDDSICKHPMGYQDWNGDRYVCYFCKEPPPRK